MKAHHQHDQVWWQLELVCFFISCSWAVWKLCRPFDMELSSYDSLDYWFIIFLESIHL